MNKSDLRKLVKEEIQFILKEDLDVVDKKNGVVQIFAVSDDFISVNPDTDSKLKNIVNKS